MSTLESQIIETWKIHNRICLFLIENLPEEALSATLSKRGGRDIARQLAHVYNVRASRLESFSKKVKIPLPQFPSETSPPKKELLKAFEQSGIVMERYIEYCLGNDGQVSNFKRGVVPMIGYYISHEAHHRGGILLTMKQSGIKIPDSLKWGIWDWNKI
jgi:uncharacterized damage-inducible protein DinB